MKHQAIHYLGLDVHQATTVASVRNEHGTVIMRATVRANADAILALVQGAGKRVRVAFERGHPRKVAA